MKKNISAPYELNGSVNEWFFVWTERRKEKLFTWWHDFFWVLGKVIIYSWGDLFWDDFRWPFSVVTCRYIFGVTERSASSLFLTDPMSYCGLVVYQCLSHYFLLFVPSLYIPISQVLARFLNHHINAFEDIRYQRNGTGCCSWFCVAQVVLEPHRLGWFGKTWLPIFNNIHYNYTPSTILTGPLDLSEPSTDSSKTALQSWLSKKNSRWSMLELGSISLVQSVKP